MPATASETTHQIGISLPSDKWSSGISFYLHCEKVWGGLNKNKKREDRFSPHTWDSRVYIGMESYLDTWASWTQDERNSMVIKHSRAEELETSQEWGMKTPTVQSGVFDQVASPLSAWNKHNYSTYKMKSKGQIK